MNGLPYYKAYPRDFIEGTIGMPGEIKCAYRLVLDLIYMQGGKLPDDARYVAGLLGYSVRKWNQIRSALIDAGKIAASDGGITAPIISQWSRWSGREIIPASVRSLIFERDGHQCAYCRTHSGPFHIDHIDPVALGGSNEPENLTVACARCNLSKGAKPLEEWLQ